MLRQVVGKSFRLGSGISRAITPAGTVACREASTVTLPDLPYDYGALEPAISGEIMQLHHSKHHQTYVTGYNKALEQYEEAEHKKDIQAQIALQKVLKFHGGGHVNHSIFWQNLAPSKEGGGEPPSGALAAAIDAHYGSLDGLVAKFSAAGAGLQGSGWVDPLSTVGLVPLLGVDMWEHSYYLQYKNVKADYLKNIWKVVNWKDVAARYESA
eukprot:jgi/Mesen1/10563/ME000843S10067